MNEGQTDDRDRIVSAMREMEAGGYRFDLDEDGEVTFRYESPAPDAHGERLSPDQWPPLTRWAVESLAEERLARLKPHRGEVRDILAARRGWGELWAEWGRQPDDPLRDAAYALRLCELAIAAGFPCYDGGQVDLGAVGWRRVTARMIAGFFEDAQGGKGEGEKGGKGEGGITPSPLLPGSPANQSDTLDKEKQEMGIKIEQTTYDAVPTGEYKAVITDISPAEGKFGPQLQIKSEINDGPYAGNTFLCWVSPKFSPKSRLYEWVEAALGMAVPKSYTFDSDHLIGREVIATLVVRELDGGGEVNRVDRVRRVTSDELRVTSSLSLS